MATVGIPTTIELGNFVTDEVPDPLVYQFNDYLGSGIDITGATVTFTIRKCVAGAVPAAGAGTAVVDPGDSTRARYTWAAADMASPGKYLGMFEASLGGDPVYKSKPIAWYVHPAVDYVAP